MRRKRKAILAAVIAASLGLILALTQIGYLPAFLPEIPLPGSLPAPDFSFLKPYGINMSFSDLVVLVGAGFLFLIIGLGLGRTARPQQSKMPTQKPPHPALVKSEVKSTLARPLVVSRKAEPNESLSAEERLSRWLEEKTSRSK